MLAILSVGQDMPDFLSIVARLIAASLAAAPNFKKIILSSFLTHLLEGDVPIHSPKVLFLGLLLVEKR
jgi:hypothetical protein